MEQFKRCCIIGGSNLIFLNNKCVLYDYKIYDKSNQYSYTDYGLFY